MASWLSNESKVLGVFYVAILGQKSRTKNRTPGLYSSRYGILLAAVHGTSKFYNAAMRKFKDTRE